MGSETNSTSQFPSKFSKKGSNAASLKTRLSLVYLNIFPYIIASQNLYI